VNCFLNIEDICRIDGPADKLVFAAQCLKQKMCLYETDSANFQGGAMG